MHPLLITMHLKPQRKVQNNGCSSGPQLSSYIGQESAMPRIPHLSGHAIAIESLALEYISHSTSRCPIKLSSHA